MQDKAAYKLILVSLASVLLLCARVNKDTFVCAGNKSKISDTQAQNLIIPIRNFPQGWYSESNAETDAKLNIDIFYGANHVLKQVYLSNNKAHYSIEASHVLALYGSEKCAKSDIDLLISHFPKGISWAPLAAWSYESPVADEYRIAALFPYRSEGSTIAGSILRLVILARYGTVISECSMNTQLENITPEQIKSIVIALDEQFSAHSELWRN